MFLGFAFSTNAFASIIVGNDSFSKSYSIGYWQYHSSLVGELKPGKKVAFLKFMVNDTDRVMISSYSGYRIEIFNSYHIRVSDSDNVDNPTTFSYAIANADSNYQTFYIKMTREKSIDSGYYSVSIGNRISKAYGKFDFIGEASNPGTPDYFANPNGANSSIISMDLTNNSTIPKKAIVKSIQTTGHLSNNLGGRTHHMSPASTNIWYEALEGKSTGRGYGISSSNKIEVAQVWNFRYNFKFKSSSTMRNVHASFYYEYDKTDQY